MSVLSCVACLPASMYITSGRFVSMATTSVSRQGIGIFKSISTIARSQTPFQVIKKEHHRLSLSATCCLFGSQSKLTTRKFTTITVSYCNYFTRSTLKYKWSFQNCRLSSKSAFEINTNLPQDTLVYTYKNDTFYKMLSYFGLFQMFVWGYMSLFAIRHLSAAPVSTVNTSDLPWWKVLIYKEGQYKNALSILCLAVGGIVMFITMTYPRRVVRNLWILKGGKEVQITTYRWFGWTHTFKKPLEHVSALQSRAGTGHHIPLKLKGNIFYFLVDKQGSFHNTGLFDFVIALKRNF